MSMLKAENTKTPAWLYDVNSIGVLHDFIYDDIMPEDNDYLKNNDNIKLNY